MRSLYFWRFWSTTILAVAGAVAFSFFAWSAEPIGWRTDGTGRYPKAHPPVEWSATKNVVWKTPMPGASNSIPVLLGHRIYICSEPCMLLCLHKDDGRILWQKNSSYDELEIDSTMREKLKLEQAESVRLDKQVSALGREVESLRKQRKENPATKEEIDKKLDGLKAKTETLKEQKQQLSLSARYTERNKQPTAGYSSPTPVTDGKEVFVAFGNGLVACFDLDSKRKWLKLIEQSTAPFAHANSPMLVGDKVLIQFGDMVALRQAIFIFLAGGPPQPDMFDMKPDQPLEVRGPFRTIRTTVPGLDICEQLPRLAQCAHRYTVLRSVTSRGYPMSATITQGELHTTDNRPLKLITEDVPLIREVL